MKTSLFILGLSVAGIAGPAFADDPTPADAKSSEKVDAVKRSEFIRDQDEIFRSADKNFDGRITHDEISRRNHDLKKPRYSAAFKAADTNNNGLISYDEIEAKHEEITEQQISRVLYNKQNLLKRYDKDGNGTITSKELDDYFEREVQKRRKQTATNAAKDMKLKDTDESGGVSLIEYLDSKAINAIKSNQAPQPAVEQTLTRDPNGDKIITRAENEAFVIRVFEVLDINKDEKLSAAEQASRVFRQTGSLSTHGLYLDGRSRSVFASK